MKKKDIVINLYAVYPEQSPAQQNCLMIIFLKKNYWKRGKQKVVNVSINVTNVGNGLLTQCIMLMFSNVLIVLLGWNNQSIVVIAEKRLTPVKTPALNVVNLSLNK